jgi:hypothetical protein
MSCSGRGRASYGASPLNSVFDERLQAGHELWLTRTQVDFFQPLPSCYS